MSSSKSIALIKKIRIMLKSSSIRREVTISPLSMRSDMSSNVTLISMLHKKLVQKVLRSLPARFRPKVAVIEKENDVTKLSFVDLLGFLKTYEKNLDVESKGKGIALKVEHNSSNATPYSIEEVIMLTQDFGNFLHRIGRISETQGRFKNDSRDTRGPNIFKSKGSTMKKKFDTGQKGKPYGAECERYGHIKVECANTLKNNRSMNTILSDNDKKSDTEDDQEDIDSNETLALNEVIDLEDTYTVM
ncbi:hypothetical protein M9H77_34343 [Catharanthus roseus]|uniref:Uncharacterized protein n=1 Tax=Catharanthus roseus TaxID=4058 RepID=A0ACB9ZMS8_CATRO|nr:hypothetical protein M9H77_34343 [Catharanthus roseus]